jgi:hypothetical protein
MGDIDNKPDKDFKSQTPIDACAAMSREVEATQMQSLSPIRSNHQDTDGGAIGRFAIVADNDDVGLGVGRAVVGNLNSLQLDFEPNANCKDVSWDKKGFDKKPDFDKKLEFDKKLDFNGKLDFNKKTIDKQLFKDPPDFAPIPLLAPSVAGFMDRVDSNRDGNMSNREINTALNGDGLNKKEKYILNVLKENKRSIDNDRNGISIADMKEFDSKITQYQKEMTLARKYVPELAEFTRELHQRGKRADDNRDGRFSKEELTSFYIECKKEFLANPTSQGKRELSALNWGVNNYDRYATMTGGPGGGQITVELLQTQLLREMDREVSPGLRQYFLSPSDRLRVERYQNSR